MLKRSIGAKDGTEIFVQRRLNKSRPIPRDVLTRGPLPLPNLCASFGVQSRAPFSSSLTVPQHERHTSCSMAITPTNLASPLVLHCTIPSRHVLSSPCSTYLCKHHVCIYCRSRARVIIACQHFLDFRETYYFTVQM